MKGRIVGSFQEFNSHVNEEEDERGLIRDFEKIGMNKRTWTKDEVEDALGTLDFNGNLVLELDWENEGFKMTDYKDGSCNITPEVLFRISGKFDQGDLWYALSEDLTKLPVDRKFPEGVKRYTMEQIRSAFDECDWDSHEESALASFDQNTDVSKNTKAEVNDEGEVYIEYKPELDYEPDPDVKEIIEDILSNL